MFQISKKEFEKLVREALDRLPGEFAGAMENISITVENCPSPEDLTSAGLDPAEDTLFGLYHGVPLPERGSAYSALPDRITLYRGPILEACESREKVVEEIRLTLIHEIGHYFGLGEKEVPG